MSVFNKIVYGLSDVIRGGKIGEGGLVRVPGEEPQNPPMKVILKPLKKFAEEKFGLGKAPNVVEGSGSGSTNEAPREVAIYSHPLGGPLGMIVEGAISPGKGGVYPLEQPKRESPPDPRRHWAVLVGGIFHELNGDLNLNVLYQNGRVDSSSYNWEKFTVGWTRYDDQAIMNAGEDTIKEMRPGYNVYDNNCQKFVIGLLNKICDPGRQKVTTTYSYITQTARGIPVSGTKPTATTPKEEEMDLPPKDEGLRLAETLMNERTPKVDPNDIGTLYVGEGGQELVVVQRA